LDKIQQDIDGILIELEDVDNNIDSNVKEDIYSPISIVGLSSINFNIKDIKIFRYLC
jgi:hypothetical protein